MKCDNLINFLMCVASSAVIFSLSCSSNDKNVDMGSSARLSDVELSKLVPQAKHGDWRAASKLYQHFNYAMRRPDLARQYKWGIEERNRRVLKEMSPRANQ